jgi:hypothetical protein
MNSQCTVSFLLTRGFFKTISYLPIMTDIHGALYRSLQEVLRHPKCASEAWMENPTVDFGQLRVRNFNVTTHFGIDIGMDNIQIAFPARLNLSGAYSHIALDINVEDQEYVR